MAALIPAIIGACVLLAVAAAAALVFRWARIPGGAPAAAIAGGILAGVLLGPSVAWRAAPDWSQRYLRGGAEAQQAVVAHRRQMQRELAAMEAGGATDEATRARASELQSAQDELQRRLDLARRAELDARIWLLLVALSSALALVGWGRARRSGFARLLSAAAPRAAPPADASPDVPAGPPRMSLPGAAMSLIPALLAAALLRWGSGTGAGGGLTAPAALAVGGAFGAGAILGPLQIRGRRVGPAADRLGMVCLVVSTAIVAAPMLREPGARPWALLLPMGALLLGWLAGWLAVPSRCIRTIAREGLLAGAVPGAVALAAGQVELDALTAGWRPTVAIVALVVLAGAGQVVGAWLGMLAIGWRAPHGWPGPMRIALEALCGGLGVMQAAGALVVLAVGAIEPWTPAASVAIAALLLSALMLELSAPATLRLWRGLEMVNAE